MKTLKYIEKGLSNIATAEPFDLADDLRKEAIIILKQNKEINTADWVEFFNIEKEFADAVLGVNE